VAAGFVDAPETLWLRVHFLPSSSKEESTGASKSAGACANALSEQSVGDFSEQRVGDVGDFAAAPPPFCLQVLVAGSGSCSSCGFCTQFGPELFVTPAAPGALYASVSVLLYQYSK
jgi:hypothetical protein